jgi:hypothetical protein
MHSHALKSTFFVLGFALTGCGGFGGPGRYPTLSSSASGSTAASNSTGGSTVSGSTAAGSTAPVGSASVGSTAPGSTAAPVSFASDVDPLFYSTLNCSTCHISLGNQFRLFKDAGQDYTQITTSGLVDTTDPASSLLLTKPVDADGSHSGGKQLDPSSAEYQTILGWIQSGANP